MMHDELNRIVLQIVGLATDNRCIVYDQDTNQQLKYKEKNLRYSSNNSVPVTKQDTIFDPSSNRGQMSSLFNFYADKVHEEDGTYVSTTSEIVDGDKSSLSLVVNGKQLKTKSYYKDSLKYVEAMELLNGCEDTSYLQKYDKIDEIPVKPKSKKNKPKPLFG